MNNFNKALERIDESLRDWFKPHRDKRTGKKFKGWVNCRTGGPCSSKSKGGKYPVCRPTHAQCKPIKHKMHKKKGHARVQWKENLNENYFPVRTSFADLPSTAPYGFWVWGNKYVIANYMDDHIKILREIMPSEYQRLGDSSLQSKAYSLGLIRVVKEGPTYHIDCTKGSPTALKLIRDIAEFYGKTVSDPFKQSSTLPVSPDSTLESIGIFKEHFFRTAAGDQRVTDTSATAEAIYADGQDSTVPAVQTLTDQTGKESVIQDVIRDLEDLKVNHNWNTKLDDDLIKAMADTLEGIGVEPTDMYAAIGADTRRQKQYLITGPSSWKGGNGALNDLKAILSGNEPQEIEEDESVPSSDLPYGSADSNPGMADLSEMNRREFIGKIAKGATAVAGGNIMPQGVAGNVLKGALGTKKLFNIDEILLNFVIPAEGRSIAAIATTRPAFLNELQFDKNTFGGLLDAINGKALNISISEKRSLEQYFSIIGMFENVITGKATKDEINTLDGFYDFEALFGKKRPSLKDFVRLYEETMEDFYENNEDIIHSVLSDALTRYQLKPETYKELSDYGYEWYHYADTPEARKLRKQEEEKIAADEKERQDNWNKEQEIERAREKEKEEIRGSRFDYAGGEEDRAAPQEWDNRTGLPKKPYGGPGTYTVDENFIDKKGPGRPGDSKRHGIKKKSSLASLDKIVKSKNASPRKKQLAHWQANMRRGKAKKKR